MRQAKYQRVAKGSSNRWVQRSILPALFGLSLTVSTLPVQAGDRLATNPGTQVDQLTLVQELTRVMGAETFRDAGIGELSAAQQRVLLQWLQRDGVAPVTPPTAGVATGVESQPEPATQAVAAPQPTSALGAEQLVRPKPPKVKENAIESSIVGAFRGWSGDTRFRLANGQIWQQRVAGRYKARLDSPKVRIEKTRFGYRLSILNSRGKSSRTVGVRRIM